MFVILKSCLIEMGPKADLKKSKHVVMQEARKDASRDWLGDGMIHSAFNLLPGRANSDFDQKMLMLALVAQKVGSKTPEGRPKHKHPQAKKGYKPRR